MGQREGQSQIEYEVEDAERGRSRWKGKGAVVEVADGNAKEQIEEAEEERRLEPNEVEGQRSEQGAKGMSLKAMEEENEKDRTKRVVDGAIAKKKETSEEKKGMRKRGQR